MRSDSIDKLAAALSKAQAVIEGAKKDSENPFFKSNYADLTSVWNAARKPLTDNGLCVVQTTDVCEDNMVVLVTTLLHSSGQWIDGEYPIISSKPDAQSMVAATTYARRAALAAIVGISPADDDGEVAMARDMPKVPQKEPMAKPLVNHAPQAAPVVGANLLAKNNHTGGSKFTKISEKQVGRLWALAAKSKMPKEIVFAYLKSKIGHENAHDIHPDAYEAICTAIEGYKPGSTWGAPSAKRESIEDGSDWTTGISEPIFDTDERLPF